MEPMVTTGRVARSLGVTINTVKAWIRKGQVRAIRLPSGHFRIPESELERLRGGESLAAQVRAFRAEWQSAPEPSATLDPPLDERLAWLERMLAEARAHGPLPERPVEEAVAHLARRHRALAHVRA